MYDKMYVECFLIRETDKARLVQIRETGKELWVPKSVIEELQYSDKLEPPDVPGKCAIMKVADWFRRKNAEAYGD